MHDNFDSSEWIGFKLPVIGIIVIIIVVIILSAVDSQKWNYGVCPKCGVNYEFVGYVGHRFTTSCIYECPECGNTVEIGMEEHKTYKAYKERMEK